MEIKILTSEVSNVANSISKYIFKEAKETKERQNIEWLNEFVNFYQSLKSCDSKRDYTYVEIEGIVKNDLSDVISKNIFNDLQNMNDENSSWLCEMMGIYNQLKDVDFTDDDKAASSDIGENYDSELRYEDIIETDNKNKKEEKKTKSKKETISTPMIIEEELNEEEPEFI